MTDHELLQTVNSACWRLHDHGLLDEPLRQQLREALGELERRAKSPATIETVGSWGEDEDVGCKRG